MKGIYTFSLRRFIFKHSRGWDQYFSVRRMLTFPIHLLKEFGEFTFDITKYDFSLTVVDEDCEWWGDTGFVLVEDSLRFVENIVYANKLSPSIIEQFKVELFKALIKCEN